MTDAPDEQRANADRVLKLKFVLLSKRHDDQMARIYSLISIAMSESTSSLPSGVAYDVLRAAVVLIHATFEDLLRTLATMSIPLMSEEFLNQVPIAGSEGRAKKFELGKLRAFESSSIKDVIHLSVMEHLEKQSFSSVDEIVSFLKFCLDIKLDKPSEEQFPDLADLIKRRHEIVHRADRSENELFALGPLRPIDAETVHVWALAAYAVEVDVLARVKERLVKAELLS
jgi:hypothetical protein